MRRTPGTRKADQKPKEAASRPPPTGPRAKPIEVAEEATPKASPWRPAGAADFMARFETGMAQPMKRLVRRRRAQSSGTFCERAWGRAARPARASETTMTRRAAEPAGSGKPTSARQARQQLGCRLLFGKKQNRDHASG